MRGPASYFLTARIFGLLAASLLLCVFISRRPFFLAQQMDADVLTPASYVWDLWHNYSWYGFRLHRVPSIFPDLMIQAAAYWIMPSSSWSLFACNWAQFLLLTLAAAYPVHLMTGRSFYQAFTVVALAIMIVLFANAVLPNAGQPNYYRVPGLHVGPFIGSLWASALVWRLIQAPTYALAIPLLVISTLSILSDKLLIVSFVLPVGLAGVAWAALFAPDRFRRVLISVAVVAASVVGAYVLDRGLFRGPDLPIDPGQMMPRLQHFSTDSIAFVRDHFPFVAVCVLLPLAIFLVWDIPFTDLTSRNRLDLLAFR